MRIAFYKQITEYRGLLSWFTTFGGRRHRESKDVLSLVSLKGQLRLMLRKLGGSCDFKLASDKEVKHTMAMAQTVINWADCSVLESVPGKLGGAWVFRGTRVPYTTVLQNICDMSVDEIAESFPTLRREQSVSFLEFLAQSAEPRP